MDADRISHLYSDHNLKAVTVKQGPIVPSIKPFPVAFQRIGETNPFLVIDNELDDLGLLKLCVASSEFVDLLTGRVA